MARNKLEKSTETDAEVLTETTTDNQSEKDTESCYTIDELATACNVLGASKIMVKAALKSKGKETYTLSEAKEIVKNFSSKEVTN